MPHSQVPWRCWENQIISTKRCSCNSFCGWYSERWTVGICNGYWEGRCKWARIRKLWKALAQFLTTTVVIHGRNLDQRHCGSNGKIHLIEKISIPMLLKLLNSATKEKYSLYKNPIVFTYSSFTVHFITYYLGNISIIRIFDHTQIPSTCFHTNSCFLCYILNFLSHRINSLLHINFIFWSSVNQIQSVYSIWILFSSYSFRTITTSSEQ